VSVTRLRVQALVATSLCTLVQISEAELRKRALIAIG